MEKTNEVAWKTYTDLKKDLGTTLDLCNCFIDF